MNTVGLARQDTYDAILNSDSAALVSVEVGSRAPSLVIAAGARAEIRFLEFFAATIRNRHTRRAYRRSVGDTPALHRHQNPMPARLISGRSAVEGQRRHADRQRWAHGRTS